MLESVEVAFSYVRSNAFIFEKAKTNTINPIPVIIHDKINLPRTLYIYDFFS